MEVWKYQYQYNDIYHAYCELLGYNPSNVTRLEQVPFLPIVMFREHTIHTGEWMPETVFKSSGTTGSIQSQHKMRHLQWYHRIAQKSFDHLFGNPAEYTWLGLLPSYMERPDSSLISMVHFFMQLNANDESHFFSTPNPEIIESLQRLKLKNQRTILIGVSFALLDLFETYKIPVWENLLIMETGGMKGKRQELTRDELYARIRENHADVRIASEYGMTELTSQAYMKDDHFIPGPTMKVFTRDISDPLILNGYQQRGAINIIDLGNLDTCSFIATDDVGISYSDHSFDVLGRIDQSDIRGCNLLY